MLRSPVGIILAAPFLVATSLFMAMLAPVHGASRISQFGITWTFDRDYPTGQFANGDYWVVGPVTIVAITPQSSTAQGVTMHGSMVNPAVNSDQGYDSRIKHNRFSPAANVGSNLPLVVLPGTSLLSSKSYRAPAKGDKPQLETIAILTVLPEPAPDGSFRPPYIGGDKTLRWNVRDLHPEKLRSLPRIRGAPSLSAMEASFARPWIEQTTNWTGRYLHPGANQPTYGREMARAAADALLLLQLNDPPSRKRTLLVRLVQYGIDIYGAARAGAAWNNDGGHNQGRKMPLLFAAALLDDADMLTYADAQAHRIFQEDQQTWFVTAADVGRPLYHDDGRPRKSYTSADIGIAEWGEKHTGAPQRDGRNWDAYYRTISGSATIGHVLAARLMHLEAAWNWPPTFDYYDRYWAVERNHAGRDSNAISRFVAEMWSAYRDEAR